MQQLPFFVRSIEYYIREAFIKYNDIDSISEHIIEDYKSRYFTKSDEKLLKLYFKNDVSQEDLDNFLSVWDIEREGGQKALLLAYFMKQHPELTYPQYVEPRLQGVLKYFQYKNMVLMSHFKKICSAIKQKNVDIMIMKGGAIRHINHDYPRIMGDIDILVHIDDYKTAVDTALSFGYKYYAFQHSIDIYDPVAGFLLDIHSMLDMFTSANYKNSIYNEFFERARSEKVFNVENIYVPCPEDAMFILLVNFNKNLAQGMGTNNFLFYIADSIFLLNSKPDFNWDIVKQNAVKSKTESQIYITLRLLNEYISTKIPVFFADEFNEKCRLLIFGENAES